MSSFKSVIISCAGIGSRLGLGQTKVLIRFHGKSLIAWQLELLKDVDDLRLVIGYQATDVVNEVLKYRKDVIFIYNHHYFETKAGASFYLGAQHANELVLQWFGDLLVHPEDVKKILAMEGEFICYSDKTSDETVYVNTNKEGDVLSFSRENGNYEWTGPVCIRRDKLLYSAENVSDLIKPHLPMRGLKIRAYDIDTYNDYTRVIELTKSWSPFT